MCSCRALQPLPLLHCHIPLLTSSLYHFTVCQSQHQTTETVCNHCGQTPHMPSLRMATTNFMLIHKSIHSQKLNKEITDDCHHSLTNTASITQTKQVNFFTPHPPCPIKPTPLLGKKSQSFGRQYQ